MTQLGLYIHLPFCDRKCDYCDFLSGPYTQAGVTSYLERLKREASLYEERFGPMKVHTVFIGGGTPTVLSPDQIHQLGDLIHCHFDLSEAAEFTFEANPESVTLEKAQAYRSIGANRVSMGLQTAEDHLLKTIGRIHSYETFEKSWAILKEAGFDNRNIDVMIGLPGQTKEGYQRSFLEILAHEPTHISAYGLILEEGTPMEQDVSQGRIELPEEALERDLYHWTCDILKARGYIHYEISNWALADKACLHNLGYWTSQPYIGLGIGAHGFIEETRYANPETVEAYEDLLSKGDLPWVEQERITRRSSIEEYLMLRLRLIEGIDLLDMATFFKEDFRNRFKSATEEGLKLGWLMVTDHRIQLTSLGLDYCNSVIQLFFEALEENENVDSNIFME